jgi:hypothetical protein
MPDQHQLRTPPQPLVKLLSQLMTVRVDILERVVLEPVNVRRQNLKSSGSAANPHETVPCTHTKEDPICFGGMSPTSGCWSANGPAARR